MSTAVSWLTSLVPVSLRKHIRQWRHRKRLAINFRYDIARFIEYGCPFREFDHGDELLAYIRMLSHALEKGMALREPRPGFGVNKARDVANCVEAYLNDYGWHDELAPAVVCLKKYAEFHCALGEGLHELNSAVERLRAMCSRRATNAPVSAGVLHLTRDEIWSRGRCDLQGFFASRHSIRQFSDAPVDLDLIIRAVRMAQKTPSVCNRQATRVYVFDNDETGTRVLACQSGNQGFGHLADKVLVITADLRQFLSIGERNQCWIDGGMFAMSLVYALHSLGLGTCCLNWSVERDADERLRAVANIARSENVIMLLAVGHLPDGLAVACSERKNLGDVLHIRCPGSDRIAEPPASIPEVSVSQSI